MDSNFIVFSLLSILNLIISWKSLRNQFSHGFFRFFTWEFLAGLLAINHQYWFVEPFSIGHVAAWIFLILSLIPLIFGVRSLIKKGKPSPYRMGGDYLLGFEKTTQLVTTGVYRWIRHPLYSSLLFLIWGVFFKNPTFSGIVLAGCSIFCLILTAKADEAECIQFFGLEYKEYMKQTKMFIPYIF